MNDYFCFGFVLSAHTLLCVIYLAPDNNMTKSNNTTKVKQISFFPLLNHSGSVSDTECHLIHLVERKKNMLMNEESPNIIWHDLSMKWQWKISIDSKISMNHVYLFNNKNVTNVSVQRINLWEEKWLSMHRLNIFMQKW